MAYYSGSGATIRSGAAGLGEYFDAAQGAAPPAPVQAFQEGVFGGGSADIWMGDVGDDPGPLLDPFQQQTAGIGGDGSSLVVPHKLASPKVARPQRSGRTDCFGFSWSG